tara:strand:- start:360 stop:539 length:180 start_codon:yes stop_codon:yes gene_type:complete
MKIGDLVKVHTYFGLHEGVITKITSCGRGGDKMYTVWLFKDWTKMFCNFYALEPFEELG